VRLIDVFVDELDLNERGFEGLEPEVTGRPRVSSRLAAKDLHLRLPQPHLVQRTPRAREPAQRRADLAYWPPDFKTIANFRKDNGKAIRNVCREFVLLCRDLEQFSDAIVAIDGSKFKAVNNRDKNFSDRKLKARMQRLEESIARYMTELDRADREPALVTEARVEHIKEDGDGQKADVGTEANRQANGAGPRTARSPKPTPTLVRWPPAVAAPVWSAITCKPPWIRSIT
jgi:hypothetical protein